MRAMVVCAKGFEPLECVSAVDVLHRAGIEVVMVSLDGEREVSSSHAVVVTCGLGLREATMEDWDLVILPGGMEAVELLRDSGLLKVFLLDRHEHGGNIGAICAAPLVLDDLDILEEGHFCCHSSVRELIKAGRGTDAEVEVYSNVVTSRSAGTSLSWGLAMVRLLLGEYPAGLLEGLGIKNPL